MEAEAQRLEALLANAVPRLFQPAVGHDGGDPDAPEVEEHLEVCTELHSTIGGASPEREPPSPSRLAALRQLSAEIAGRGGARKRVKASKPNPHLPLLRSFAKEEGRP